MIHPDGFQKGDFNIIIITNLFFHMSKRSTKSKLKVATVQKTAELLRHQYYLLQLQFTESYSFYTQTFLTRIVKAAQPYLLQYPVQSILNVVLKKFCLNQLQLVFVYHLLNSSEWNTQNRVITSNFKAMRVDEDQNYKQALLYFYLVCYACKYYLNGQNEAEVFLTILMDQVPKFEGIFEEWVESTPKNFMVIEPSELNRAFRELARKETESLKTDYNKLVQDLLLISPSYKLIENMERTKLQEFKEVEVNHSQILENNRRSLRNSDKKIKLNLDSENDQQEVNDHLGNIFQSIQFTEGEPPNKDMLNRGSFSGINEVSDLGGFMRRKPSSQLSKFFNLQRSSIYDWA